jgi:sensor histidine kinase YesM
MASRNYQFWLFYTVAWLLYAACLGAVFLGVGNRLGFNLLLTIFCNVAPAALLGLLVFQICRQLKWSERRRPRFALIHLLSLVSFSALWCFLTLLGLSLLSFLQRGVWAFVRWDLFALQWQFFSGVMAYATIASAVYVKQINENLQAEERRSSELRLRAVRAEAARASAELSALRAQLNPHFLFNTLHSLMALVRTDADTAEEAIERFALMLRYVLRSQEKSETTTDVTFGEEWNFVQNYLELERLRLGERLQLKTEIEPATFAYRLPAFTLQPIVENAVKHGVAPRAGGGRLHIEARINNENLIITVRDDGCGESPANEENGNGLGLRLVRESLWTRFGSAACIKTETTANQGFKVSIIVPSVDSSEEGFKALEVAAQNLC